MFSITCNQGKGRFPPERSLSHAPPVFLKNPRLFNDPDFTVDFEMPKADRRAKALATRLKDETKSVHILRALDLVVAQPEGALRKLPIVTKFKEVQNLPKG